MSADRVVLAGYLVRCPLGGYAWQILHYLIGLRQAGFDPYFYEDTAYDADCFDPTTGAMHVAPDAGIATTATFLRRFGFGDKWAFWDADRDQHYGLSAADTAALLRDAPMVITLAAVTRVVRAPGQKKVFIDIDPAFTQIRVAQGEGGLCEFLDQHDRHFTIGENIGTPGCRIPTVRYGWQPTRQPIAVELWAAQPGDPPAAFTTIGRWDEHRRDVELDGEIYSWRKRVEWMKFLDLPQRTGESFLVAMDVDKTAGDRQLLAQHGWKIIDPLAVSRDPLAYRDFICRSKGEFTVAKDLNVRLRSGWFSDRSACYLAAGRPVVTQHTGFDRTLPTGAGVLAFADVEEAAQACIAIATDYAHHAAAARRIAAEFFDARRVLDDLIRRL